VPNRLHGKAGKKMNTTGRTSARKQKRGERPKSIASRARQTDGSPSTRTGVRSARRWIHGEHDQVKRKKETRRTPFPGAERGSSVSRCRSVQVTAQTLAPKKTDATEQRPEKKKKRKREQFPPPVQKERIGNNAAAVDRRTDQVDRKSREDADTRTDALRKGETKKPSSTISSTAKIQKLCACRSFWPQGNGKCLKPFPFGTNLRKSKGWLGGLGKGGGDLGWSKRHCVRTRG